MLYHVKLKFKGTVSRMSCCDSCGQLIDHECKDVVAIDTIVDKPSPEEAVRSVLAKSGFELMYPHEWLEEPMATPVATDRAMRFIDAPMLPGMQL